MLYDTTRYATGTICIVLQKCHRSTARIHLPNLGCINDAGQKHMERIQKRALKIVFPMLAHEQSLCKTNLEKLVDRRMTISKTCKVRTILFMIYYRKKMI